MIALQACQAQHGHVIWGSRPRPAGLGSSDAGQLLMNINSEYHHSIPHSFTQLITPLCIYYQPPFPPCNSPTCGWPPYGQLLPLCYLSSHLHLD